MSVSSDLKKGLTLRHIFNMVFTDPLLKQLLKKNLLHLQNMSLYLMVNKLMAKTIKCFFLRIKDERFSGYYCQTNTRCSEWIQYIEEHKDDRCVHYGCENLKQEWDYHSGKYNICSKVTGKITIGWLPTSYSWLWISRSNG